MLTNIRYEHESVATTFDQVDRILNIYSTRGFEHYFAMTGRAIGENQTTTHGVTLFFRRPLEGANGHASTKKRQASRRPKNKRKAKS